MLQQTRVAAVIPYYERFLARFPTVQSLAQAREEDVLACWSGLGYYSRARNLQKAARQIVGQVPDLPPMSVAAGREPAPRRFPSTFAALRELAGVGDYTAAALASIAFWVPHAVIDGNVKRVVARLTGSASADVRAVAERLLDRQDPGRSNQALMELGALICVPREPKCDVCPIVGHCEAKRAGIVDELPPTR